jgi:hypothetical protein
MKSENPFEKINRITSLGSTDPINAGPDVEAKCYRLMRAIERNPVYRQYIARIDRTDRSINDEPWHAIGERYYAAWQCLMSAQSGGAIPLYGLAPGAPRRDTLYGLAHSILGAVPYLWSDKMEKLADAAPLPKHVTSYSVMPHPFMFWSRESRYSTAQGSNNWLALFYTGNRIIVLGDFSDDLDEDKTKPPKLALMSDTVNLGKTWPTDYNGDKQIGIILKRCAFLNSPYIDSAQGRLPRHQRRQLERIDASREEVDVQINVVTLRHRVVKPEHQVKPPDEGVDWKHKWWVSGHYRAQWYPSEKSHKVIWIAPFLKGPEDAPLLEKIYTVVR